MTYSSSILIESLPVITNFRSPVLSLSSLLHTKWNAYVSFSLMLQVLKVMHPVLGSGRITLPGPCWKQPSPVIFNPMIEPPVFRICSSLSVKGLELTFGFRTPHICGNISSCDLQYNSYVMPCKIKNIEIYKIIIDRRELAVYNIMYMYIFNLSLL